MSAINDFYATIGRAEKKVAERLKVPSHFACPSFLQILTLTLTLDQLDTNSGKRQYSYRWKNEINPA